MKRAQEECRQEGVAHRDVLQRETSAVGRNRGGFLARLACSYAYANLMSFGSLQARPKNDTPTGMPNTKPAGTVTLG